MCDGDDIEDAWTRVESNDICCLLDVWMIYKKYVVDADICWMMKNREGKKRGEGKRENVSMEGIEPSILSVLSLRPNH